MTQTIEINSLHCLCALNDSRGKIAYILYPMDILDGWIEDAAEKYGTSIVVITGMDWQNALTPWAATGVPKGTPDFKGEGAEFLRTLQLSVIPEIEERLGIGREIERILVGVSLSGLFTLWQWLQCDTFKSIASLSGSFWYEGFLEWVENITIPVKTGKAYFSLGNMESKSKVKAFDSVGVNTETIVSLLRRANIKAEFQSVPGNHYANPIPRLEKAFSALFLNE